MANSFQTGNFPIQFGNQAIKVVPLGYGSTSRMPTYKDPHIGNFAQNTSGMIATVCVDKSTEANDSGAYRR